VSFRDGKRRFRFNLRQIPQESGRIDDSFVDEQNRKTIPNRIYPLARRAFQSLGRRLELKRFLASRTHQKVE
jgi:hypothetical protein